MTTWTEERIERVAQLAAEGRSASQIASDLGDGATRNGVIGLAHRRGIKLGLQPSTRPKEARPKPSTPSRQPAPVAATPEPEPIPAEVHRLFTPARPTSGPVTIMELRTGLTCAWPLWSNTEKGGLYCGDAVTREACSFCEAHCRVAFQPSAERKQARAA